MTKITPHIKIHLSISEKGCEKKSMLQKVLQNADGKGEMVNLTESGPVAERGHMECGRRWSWSRTL